MQDSEKRIYYDIITKCWTAFSRQRLYPEFSDPWWSELIADFAAICREYRNTDYAELVDKLTMELQNQHERRQKEWREL